MGAVQELRGIALNNVHGFNVFPLNAYQTSCHMDKMQVLFFSG